jgi:hypothetical protein
MSETSESINSEENSDLELTYDYMLSLKMFIEEEYNILSENDEEIILELISYLREMKVPNDKIRTALHLLYDTLDPTKKELIDSICVPSPSSNLSNLFLSMVNNHVDPFTGDVINPANIINMFAANLNNLPHNQNIQITFDTTNQLNTITPAHLNFFSPLFASTNIFSGYTMHILDQHQANTLDKSDLDETTKIITFNELPDDVKTKYNTCFICLADFDKEDTIREIKCEHIFHKVCIDPWLLKENKTCPVCRK